MGAPNITSRAFADVVEGVSKARKVVVTDRRNKVDSLDMTAVKIGGTTLTATATELNKLDGGAVTNTELNKLAGATLTTTELNKLTGATLSTAELNTLTGILAVVAELNELQGITEAPIQTAEVTFTQEAGNKTHTGTVTLPAGATLLDIVVTNLVLWDSGTSATMKVGDATTDDGYFTAVDLKATNLLADESVRFGYTGGLEGADLDGGEAAGDHVRRLYDASSRDIVGVITDVNVSGAAGRTRMTVVFSLPGTPVAATVT
ncbi:hypothetical protein LCGC14_0423310 [marine sediment metagenome]|uniref:Uncharacterized protein n=1 Tax=marine sediment metagenome TaxID=412755 RepID=A0A0F9VZD8_9ZZZZ